MVEKKAKRKVIRGKVEREYRYGPPLTAEEAGELNELIAEFSEEGSEIQDIAGTDGFLVGVKLCLINLPTKDWLEMLFGTFMPQALEEGVKQEQLKKLLLRRYDDISKQLRNSEIFEPYYSVDGDEDVATAEQQIEALAPFVDAFLNVVSLTEGESEDLPDDLEWNIGLTKLLSLSQSYFNQKDLSKDIRSALNQEREPLVTKEDVLFQLATGVALIANSMQGYPINPLIDEYVDYGNYAIEEDSPDDLDIDDEDEVTPSVT